MLTQLAVLHAEEQTVIKELDRQQRAIDRVLTPPLPPTPAPPVVERLLAEGTRAA